MKTTWITVMASLALAGCGSMYVPHDGKVPHGYQERYPADGELEVSYETYKRITHEEACELARRRLEELVGDRELKLTARRVEERDDVIRVREMIGPVAFSSPGKMNPSTLTGETVPAYDIARIVTRCTLKAELFSSAE